jgi:hypothetical protein
MLVVSLSLNMFPPTSPAASFASLDWHCQVKPYFQTLIVTPGASKGDCKGGHWQVALKLHNSAKQGVDVHNEGTRALRQLFCTLLIVMGAVMHAGPVVVHAVHTDVTARLVNASTQQQHSPDGGAAAVAILIVVLATHMQSTLWFNTYLDRYCLAGQCRQ